MAASMWKNVPSATSTRVGHHLSQINQLVIFTRALSTAPKGQRKLTERTNWSLDTPVQNHRRHDGVRHLKAVRLPETLTANISAALAGQTARNLVPQAVSLSNYLASRKRPIEEGELRAAARHYSRDFGIEDLEIDDVSRLSLPEDARKKMDAVMKHLRRNLYRWKFIEYDEVKSLAYVLSRMAPNYAVLNRVLHEIRRGDPEYHPTNILDFGSGIGTTVWAAHNVWQDLVKEYYLVEVSKSMHGLAERLLQMQPGGQELHIPNVYFRYFLPVSHRSRYSITISAYSLLELPTFQDRINTIRALWRMTDDYMVLIENGTYESYLALMEARDAILQDSSADSREQSRDQVERESQQVQDRLFQPEEQQGASVFAPCPHDQTCPRLEDQSGTPCNFEQSFHPLPQYKGKKSPDIETERFCYVILKKGQRPTASDWPRVVRPVLRKARMVTCRLCRTDGTLGEAVITKGKHSKDFYRCARYTRWGDILPATQGDMASLENSQSDDTPSHETASDSDG